jgi:hypothetical protein
VLVFHGQSAVLARVSGPVSENSNLIVNKAQILSEVYLRANKIVRLNSSFASSVKTEVTAAN